MVFAFWIVSGVTALAFLAAGILKLVRSRAALKSMGLAWVEDFSEPVIKLIAVAEILGALGLVLPPLIGILPILSPIAAIALAVLMFGATIVHVRRQEPPISGPLAALSVAAAILGFLVLPL
jgi:uncharacterized membrane protein YphA (DoxX/SURF4 family)